MTEHVRKTIKKATSRINFNETFAWFENFYTDLQRTDPAHTNILSIHHLWRNSTQLGEQNRIPWKSSTKDNWEVFNRSII